MTDLVGQSAFTSIGFFWKAAWAFIMGYAISAMIQTFVPKSNLIKHMGGADAKSIGLATLFGAASSSCSFAALGAARALITKGASFIAGVAFMFASTNLVIELGILIYIFLGWEFLAAEIGGGFVLITISSIIIAYTAPKRWLDSARDELEQKHHEEDFDWRKRIVSARGWRMVGNAFAMEWQMVWREILIGFTLAGIVAVFIPQQAWETIFLANAGESVPQWLRVLENVIVGPLVAAMTFIGSMGNIPLATVLSANGVAFAGIMAFIYSDLMVPPLVAVNAKYYGWRVALYIAGVMFVSIIVTALSMEALFSALGMVPESDRVIHEVVRFQMDYTFWLNIAFGLVAAAMLMLHHAHGDSSTHGHDAHSGHDGHEGHDDHSGHDHGNDGPVKIWATRIAGAWLLVGAAIHFLN